MLAIHCRLGQMVMKRVASHRLKRRYINVCSECMGNESHAEALKNGVAFTVYPLLIH